MYAAAPLLWNLCGHFQNAAILQGQFWSPSCWREANSRQQHVYRLKLNNNEETPWQPHGAVIWHARVWGEEGFQELGWSLWAHNHPRSQQAPRSQGAQAATEKAILRSTHQLRPRQGEGKARLGSDHKIQGEEPLGKESWDRSGGAERPTGGFLGQWPHFVQFMLTNLSIPLGTGQLITQRTATVVTARLSPAAGSGKQRCCISFHGNQNQRSSFPPKSH